MAVREIKTSIALDGEQAFKQAVADINRNLRVMDAELKLATTEFKVTGNAQSFLTEKSWNLREQIKIQEQAIDTMNEAMRNSIRVFGENSAETDAWRIKISNATSKLWMMRKELADTDREAEEFGRDSRRVGRQIEDGIGDGAEEANKSVKSLIESLQEDVGSIKGSMAFQVATTVTQGVINAVQGVTDFVQSNQEYRRAMAGFEQAAKMGNHDVEAMKSLLNGIVGFTGDFDEARETLIALMQTGMTGEWINTASEIFKYISILFDGSLDMASLAQDFQNTVSKGKADGQVIDLLERMGKSENEFNKIMSDAGTAEARSIAALTYLAPAGYKTSLEDYNEKTKGLQEAAVAQMELTAAYAELAEALEPLTTKIIKWQAQFIDAAKNAVKGLKSFLEGNNNWIYGEGKTSEDWINETQKAIEEYQKENGQNGIVENPIWTMVKSWFVGAEAEEQGKEDGTAYATGVKEGLLNDEELTSIMDQVWEAYRESTQAAYQKMAEMGLTEEQMQQVIDGMMNIIVDMSSEADTTLKTEMDSVANNAYVAGKNAGIKLGNGLAAGLSSAYNTTLNYVNAINSLLSGVGNGPLYGLSGGGYYNGMGGTSRIKVTVPLSINGREVARATMPYINSMQGQQTSRESRVSK